MGMSLCERLTLYSDRGDTALWFSDLLSRRGKSLGRHTEPIFRAQGDLHSRIDVIDCTLMDANVNGIRHSYFDLNTHVLSDISELVSTGLPASRRSRLVRISLNPQCNVY